jgi:glycosyltransferase involved in cell wall biosynthesis
MNDKIKVLHITGDAVGGIRKHIHDIIYNMNEHYDFYYISSFNNDKVSITEKESIEKLVESRIRLDISKKPTFFDIVNIFLIYRIIRKNKIKIVHGHGAKGGLYARIAGKLAGAKVIYTPHGGVAHDMFSGSEDKIYKLIEKILSSFTSCFLFESNYTKKAYFKKIKPKKNLNYAVNYNGVNVGLIEQSDNTLPSSKKNIKIGFFGVLRNEKGILFSIDAINDVINSINIELSYHIYGDGPLLNEVENKINNLSCQKKIYLHGETDNPYMAMHNMDIIFVPSKFESFGYVAVESMFLEKTLVVSDAGALPEVCCPDSSYFFRSNDLPDCVRALKKAIYETIDGSNYKKLTDASFFAKKHYSIETMCNNLSSLYKKLL